MDNVKLVKTVEWDEYIECHFKIPQKLVEYIYENSNIPAPALWGTIDYEECEYTYSFSKREPWKEFMKKVVETIEGICNQNDEDYLINHLITRNGKIPAPADVHKMMREEYGLSDINKDDEFDSFDSGIEWYTAHFFIQLGNQIYDPFVDDWFIEHEIETDAEEEELLNSSGEVKEPETVAYEEKEPPQFLYHGTAPKNYRSIVVDGLIPKTTSYVHLTADFDEAVEYGRQFGRPAVFVVRSGDMYKEGYKFYQTKDGVWLADGVPCEYLAVKFAKVDFSKIDKIVIVDDARTFDPDSLLSEDEK